MLHDTSMSQYIPPTLFHRVTGAWTHGAGAVTDTIAIRVDDANQTSTVNIPIIIPSNSSGLKGSKLKSVEIDYEVLTAAMTSVTAVFNKVTRGADGAVAVVESLAFSYDTGHDTAGERLDVDQHKMTLTLTTPQWVDNDAYFLVKLTIDQVGDTGVVDLLAAVANYTLRL